MTDHTEQARALIARLKELRERVRGCRGDEFISLAPSVVDTLREAELAFLAMEKEANQNAKDMMAHEQRALADCVGRYEAALQSAHAEGEQAAMKLMLPVQKAWQALDDIMVDAGMPVKYQPEQAQAWLRERLAEREAGQPSRTCDTCTSRGHGFQAARGGHYPKCLRHSLPCEELGNTCGKWEEVVKP